MNDVPNPVTKDTGTLGTMTSQDVKRLLSIKMPGRESEFKDWQQYNEQQYTVLLIVSATEEEKKEAMSNLLNANKPLFTKRARKEKLMSCGLDFEDIIQIEMLNFIEAINKATEEAARRCSAFCLANSRLVTSFSCNFSEAFGDNT